MIPFEDLVTALERFKQRKATPAPVPAPAVTSGKAAVSGKQQMRQVSLTDLGDALSEE